MDLRAILSYRSYPAVEAHSSISHQRGLQPLRVRRFKLSKNPHFVDKLRIESAFVVEGSAGGQARRSRPDVPMSTDQAPPGIYEYLGLRTDGPASYKEHQDLRAVEWALSR